MVIDYGRSEPIRIKGWTLLVMALFLSRKIRTYKSTRIGLALPPGVAGIFGNLAVLFAGKIPVNLNLTVSKQSMISTLREAGIDVMLSAEGKERNSPTSHGLIISLIWVNYWQSKKTKKCLFYPLLYNSGSFQD